MPEEGGAAGMSASDPRMPEHMETQRTHVICGPDLNYHVSTVILQAQRPLPAAGKLQTVPCRLLRRQQQICTWHLA